MTNLLNNTLYIVSTPIGNLDDITLRAIQVLKSSDIILCEDTRHSLKLLNHLNIKKKLISYHKFNEKKQIPNIIEYINQGKILSLISDAGTPMLSDPGKHLLNECLKNKIKITPIPGVSSVTASMSVAGFEDKFLFYGFLPKKDKELDKVLTKLSNLNYSQVFFIPALKINFYLNKFKIFFNDRKIMIAKEVTKIHEFFYREDVNGYWSHKTGHDPITNLDASGNRIRNPEKIDRNYDKIDNDHFNYGKFCGYFSVKYNGKD